MIRTSPEYSYASVHDLPTFHPVLDGVVEDGDESIKSTLVVKSVGGIITIPISGPLDESEDIFEVHNIGTQTESLATHGLQEIYDNVDDDQLIGQSAVIHDVDNFGGGDTN